MNWHFSVKNSDYEDIETVTKIVFVFTIEFQKGRFDGEAVYQDPRGFGA
jgi:hypothetical protein